MKTPNVVEATNKPGLYEKLEDMKKRWVPAAGTRAGQGGHREPSPGFKHPFLGSWCSPATPSPPEGAGTVGMKPGSLLPRAPTGSGRRE